MKGSCDIQEKKPTTKRRSLLFSSVLVRLIYSGLDAADAGRLEINGYGKCSQHHISASHHGYAAFTGHAVRRDSLPPRGAAG